MSTRSNIKLVDNTGEILLYKHHDGYPEGGPGMINFLKNRLDNSGKSAEWMAKLMIEETECEVSAGLHGDIAYYYEVNVELDSIKTYKVDMATGNHERIFPEIEVEN